MRSSDAIVQQSTAPVLAITGSSGYVGKHLVPWLTMQGYGVRAISRTPTGTTPVGEEWRSVADYTDVVALAEAFKGSQAVIHLAARAHVFGVEPPQKALETFKQANIVTSLACAEAALHAGCRRFVLVSSIGVNGSTTHGQPFTERDEVHPQGPYAYTKWQAECAVAELLNGSPLELVIVRPPLVYGPGCPGNFRTLLRLIRFLPALPFGALQKYRSYIGIKNLCSALQMAALHQACAGESFVLSDGEDINLASMTRLLANSMGRSHVPQWSVPPRLLQILAKLTGRHESFTRLSGELLVDSNKFRQRTGWEPPLTLLQGLIQAAEAHPKATLSKFL